MRKLQIRAPTSCRLAADQQENLQGTGVRITVGNFLGSGSKNRLLSIWKMKESRLFSTWKMVKKPLFYAFILWIKMKARVARTLNFGILHVNKVHIHIFGGYQLRKICINFRLMLTTFIVHFRVFRVDPLQVLFLPLFDGE